MVLIPLAEATTEQCGGKAGGLGALLRARFPVPDGVVIPYDGLNAAELGRWLGADELARWLESVGDVPVAVRSSASNEDTALTSAAGQHDSFLGVQGLDAIVDAVHACRASLSSPRATAYRTGPAARRDGATAYGDGSAAPSMAVIVQRHVDADVSGVLFTAPDGGAVIEASWGLGPSVVEGRVTPDRYEVTDGSVRRTIADKPTALHREGSRLVVRTVPAARRRTPTLSDATAVRLADLGHRVARLLRVPQDIEWALTSDTLWLLQTRPITAQLPHPPDPPHPARPTAPTNPAALTGVTGPAGLTGIPGSQGLATGPARIVRGPADFPQVRPGDILVCPFTDPAWTPLLTIAAGVVTETGGILSHAAIVARERGIPAVLSVPNATTHIPNTTQTTINGTTGTIHLRMEH